MTQGFTYTGRTTPATIETDSGMYTAMLKKSGYKDKIIANITAITGVTKSVSGTLEPATLPPLPSICSWIDETGFHNLTREHWLYVYNMYIGANAAAEALYSVLSPKPSRIPSSLVTRENWLGLYNYTIDAISSGNALLGCNY